MQLKTKTQFMRDHHLGYAQLQEMIDKGQIEMVGNRIKDIESFENKIVLPLEEYQRLISIEARFKVIAEQVNL